MQEPSDSAARVPMGGFAPVQITVEVDDTGRIMPEAEEDEPEEEEEEEEEESDDEEQPVGYICDGCGDARDIVVKAKFAVTYALDCHDDGSVGYQGQDVEMSAGDIDDSEVEEAYLWCNHCGSEVSIDQNVRVEM